MEIKLNNICTKSLKNINIKFTEKEITALVGNTQSIKKNIINAICGLEKIISGEVKYGRIKQDENTTEEKMLNIKKNIFYVGENSSDMLFNINVKEDIKFYLGDYDALRLEELLKNFNLNTKILESSYLDLSSSEARKILLIIALMSNTKILILETPNIYLDNKSVQTLIKELKKLKRDEKIILITSYNSDFLLEVSDNVILMDDNKIIKEGNKYEILSNEKLLERVNVEVPKVLEFINKVKELKNIRLGYRDNINDLIKDIYRHAK
jgi:energy-coupling factor transport system ATP-binding protein